MRWRTQRDTTMASLVSAARRGGGPYTHSGGTVSTNAHSRVGGYVGVGVHPARPDEALTSPTYVAPADATSAGRDNSGRQRPRAAPSADRNVSVVTPTAATSEGRKVSGPHVSGVTSASRTSERRYVSGQQRQSGVTSASRSVRALRQSVRGATSERRNFSVAQSRSRFHEALRLTKA